MPKNYLKQCINDELHQLELYAKFYKSRYDNVCYLTQEKIMKKTFLASCLFAMSGLAMALALDFRELKYLGSSSSGRL